MRARTVGPMKVITQDSFGGPEVLHLAERPEPTALPTEVVVQLRASALNPVDASVRSGQLPLLGPPPFVLGWDISGIVDSVVPGVTRFQPGDEVFGMPFFPRAGNAYAQYVAVPSRQLAAKPRSLTHVQAAAIPLAGLTAWQSIVDTASVHEGQTILIHAAGGGVGHLAVQIAKARGARVIATASAGKLEFVRSLGADEVIDYGATDFAEAAGKVDVVLDTVGGEVASASIDVLRPGGLLVTIIERKNAALAERVHESGRRFAGITVEPDHVGLEALAALVESGQLRPVVSQTFDFADAAEAHRSMESGSVTGKIVLAL
jgi:NADPH:quinone reductase-like Zn-dependent oxidoreductase